MTRKCIIVTVLLFLLAEARAGVIVDTVLVGNVGNLGEPSGINTEGPDVIAGGVNYIYQIGKFEITNGQYVEFLNAVTYGPGTDYYELFSWSSGIVVSHPAGVYSVSPTLANRPVNYISWGDAARFANWMHNGQPTGLQGLATTEDGSYYLNGAVTATSLMAVTRKSNATWVIPTEDEWYKAAYHKNDGVTGNYWEYPTSSDIVPSNLIYPDIGNNATYNYSDRTNVGQHVNSESPYGTFDQGGNLWEWNETAIDGNVAWYRGFRGGSYSNGSDELMADHRRIGAPPSDNGNHIGFRLALVPEPNILAILMMIGLARRYRN